MAQSGNPSEPMALRDPRITAGSDNGLRLLTGIFAALCLAFALITPPMQGPDEDVHFFKAYKVSLGGAVAVPGPEGTLGFPLPRAVAELAHDRFPPQPYPEARVRYAPEAVIAAFREADASGPPVFLAFPTMAPYAPTMYLPQAAGIALARQLGWPVIAQFYAGRVANALAGAALILAAVALAPVGRAAFLAIALMGTTPSLLGTMSADSTITGVGFLCLALALRGALAMPLSRPEAWATPFAFVVLGLAKGVYLPLGAAGLRLRLQPRQWLLLGSMALGAACFVGWLLFGRGADVAYFIVSRRTLEVVPSARPSEQLAFILAAPADYLGVLTASFTERLPVYVVQVIGRFGWNTIMLPLPAYGLGFLLAGLAIVAPYGRVRRPPVWQRLWWLAIVAGLVVAIETAMYLTGTRYGANYIQGVQGRYFLPFLPLLLLALALPLDPSGRWGRLACRAFPVVALALAFVSLATVVDAYWISGFTRARMS